MKLERKGIKTRVITGLVSLVAIVGVIAFDIANKYLNAPISYDSGGSPLYTQMISDAANNRESYRKAKFGSSVNYCGGFNSEEEMNRYLKHFESTLSADLCRRVVEIPDKKTIERSLANITRYVSPDGTKVSNFNGSGMNYWLEVYAFDRDEIRDFEVYEVDPVTKEKIRRIEVGNTPSGNTKWGEYTADTRLEFDEPGVGSAKLLRLDINDKKGNKYHSFIELKEKV
jgi:hypothetical protein